MSAATSSSPSRTPLNVDLVSLMSSSSTLQPSSNSAGQPSAGAAGSISAPAPASGCPAKRPPTTSSTVPPATAAGTTSTNTAASSAPAPARIEPKIRIAREDEDVERAAELVSAAFQSTALAEWCCIDPEERSLYLDALNGGVVRQIGREGPGLGHIFVSGDFKATLVCSYGASRIEFPKVYPNRRTFVIDRLLEQANEAIMPPDDHWIFVLFLATAPDAHGRGHGRSLMKVACAHADQLGYAMYLENTTSNEAITKFYKSFGFRTWRTDVLDPQTDLVVHYMRREPRVAQASVAARLAAASSSCSLAPGRQAGGADAAPPSPQTLAEGASRRGRSPSPSSIDHPDRAMAFAAAADAVVSVQSSAAISRSRPPPTAFTRGKPASASDPVIAPSTAFDPAADQVTEATYHHLALGSPEAAAALASILNISSGCGQCACDEEDGAPHLNHETDCTSDCEEFELENVPEGWLGTASAIDSDASYCDLLSNVSGSDSGHSCGEASD
ncbi:hypothetical protein H696_02315 [Fonticula alba]|uniref:N-acetyltransferase domain-containing protein n=1 Tax=Fonticula alba TaxID=691883 RepID=A0A058ZBR4_FONAL|nr:hypothetical protein H696_02315 [Fonticula alba]KCV71363.1 hypothetical protein H696_02315 [Fonticula alba]|eukprot:XP_009494486.1 hypothetical protein H696_02315 [Fonticula alba]